MIRFTENFSSLFKSNREKLSNLLKENAVAIIFSSDLHPRNGDQFFDFRQNSTLFYLSGLDQKGAILVLIPSHPDPKYREIAFIPESDEISRLWNGYSYSKTDAQDISGIETILWSASFDETIQEILEENRYIYLLKNEYPKFKSEVEDGNSRQGEALRTRFPEHNFLRLAPLTTELRMVKESKEILLMQKACDITQIAFANVMEKIHPGMAEYAIEAEMIYHFIREGGSGAAYKSICASGINACILHYTSNEALCEDGELILMDFGAEYHNYAADCSRTIPVNGTFSPRQKACYAAVLSVMKKAESLYVPGNSISKINRFVWGEMEKEMVDLGLFTWEDVKNQDPENPIYKKYIPHGVAHHIGLDVHDVVELEAPFVSGMVLTLEPGLYIADEKIGIRIENDILVGDTPRNLMANIPCEIDDIELFMNNNR